MMNFKHSLILFGAFTMTSVALAEETIIDPQLMPKSGWAAPVFKAERAVNPAKETGSVFTAVPTDEELAEVLGESTSAQRDVASEKTEDSPSGFLKNPQQYLDVQPQIPNPPAKVSRATEDDISSAQ